MDRRTFWKSMQALLFIVALPWGVNTASAGPGGGTYYANSPAGGLSGTALRKFVDSLPGVGAANKNNLGQYIPLATPDTSTFPGSDYYVIGLKDYTQKMHSDLPKATKLRGYYQINGTDHTNQYLGPLILATEGRPVRVRFENHLGTGAAGNLFLPVDTTAMGAGMAPYHSNGTTCDPSLPGANCAKYTQNRATLHLHGGNTPWISDGTPHQWTAPVGETSVPVVMRKGVSTHDVPDMPASGDGAMTFYFTNQQSNRLMFYHDHAYGMTRLNVYAGEAAGYLLTDPTEEGLINSGVLPNLGGVYRYGIPLVIQDRTFVPQNVAVQDAKWNTNTWGQPGDLWFPHVYEPNQNPDSPEGANPFGRWDYGPWFWPPVPVAPDKATLPDPSLVPEGFMDTPIVNGTAYPYLTVQPKVYRFRILNACNDRTLNLQLYYADPNDPTGKDVKMVPAGPNPDFPPTWPTDGRDGGVPDPALVGPKMIQIGTEGGFLPAPVVLDNTPIGYNYNRRDIVVLNVENKTLLLGAAERADVIIDFSSVPPGSNIILYNDAPAPTPAFDPRYDYYTGNPDQTPSGGAPSTMRGYGPNTRTIMQFRVAGTPSAPFNLPALQTALPVAFKASQPAPIVPQSTYPLASGGNAATDLYSKIQDNAFTYKPVGSSIPTTIQFKSKAIQELWDPYGRMNATLGVEMPFTNNTIQTTVPMGYAEPATEYISDGQPQIWKITHNGVDTHPVHFHLFNVQLINRVGWDGAIRPPDDNEIGWKETVRMNPLEDAIVAFKPVTQTLPFSLPTSSRLLDPTLPPGSPITTTDVSVTPPVLTTIPNEVLNYGFEYVWHCHILGHEENDFMRPIIFDVPTTRPTAPTGLLAYTGGTLMSAGPPAVYNSSVNSVILTWTDTGTTPSSFRVERATVTGTGTVGPYTPLATLSFLSVVTPTYTDNSVAQNTRYKYRVVAFNTKGDSSAAVSATVTTKTWGRATGLTIKASVPSPHIMGTLVNFTGVGTGATDTVANASVTYQYRFWLTSGGVKTLVQDYGYGASWALPETTPVGNYVITVDVRTSPTGNTNPSGGYDVSKTMSYSIVVPTSPPLTVPTPVPGVYSASAPAGAPASPVTVNVTLTATTPYPPATIYYTTDGTVPTTATLDKFTNSGTIPPITATTTVQYFAVDINGVAEAVHTDSWTIHAPDLSVGSSVVINNGAGSTNNTTVSLTLNATDPLGISTMQFSNDNTVWSIEEPFATTKAWVLASGGADDQRTVYVKVRDKSLPIGTQYSLSGTIKMDTVAPVTTASPISGIYAAAPIPVTLTTNEPATIYYTVDGTDPTTSATRQTYVAPIGVSATTTIKYYAVDMAGNSEAVKSGVWTVNTAGIVASVVINDGAAVTGNQSVKLTLNATASNPGLTITQMQFSNDGSSYSAAEPYSTTKLGYSLGAGDGTKTVYVKFLDDAAGGSSNYPAVNASIILDTVAPVTTASPTAGGYASVPLPVTLITNEEASIYYTTDGSLPTTASTRYTGPISVATTTTIKYFSVDAAGNPETVKTGNWNINPLDLIASATVNNGATFTNNRNVTLTLNASDPTGVATMRFSNTGVPGSYSSEEPYDTTKAWSLDHGDGVKTVYVQFRDNDLPTGTLYDPVTAQITLDTVAPVSTITPVPGTYAAAPINVTLASEPGASIYYTVNGNVPTTASTLYNGPFGISADTTVQYFAMDQAGNQEAVKSAAYKISVQDLNATVGINNGAAFTRNTAVTLNLDAVGVVAMQFSNDGVNFTTEEQYAASKAWQLAPGESVKTVYVKFRDGALGGGKLYGPFTASITLDTIAPATTISPVSGIYAAAPVSVTLATEPNAAVYYTVDGTDPTTASTLYTGSFNVSAVNTTVKYFAVDRAGNQEAVKSDTYSIPVQSDMVAGILINSGASVTNNTAVTLNLDAADPAGVVKMQFSNNGVNYTVEEPYAPSKAWTLDTGNGLKTVYVRFRDGAGGGGTLYGPFTASITMDTVAPVTTAGPIPGTYSTVPVSVTLAANEPATIYYTIDGSMPTTGSAVYTGPISVADTTTIRYFAVDTAGNTEAIKSGTWTVHSQDMASSVLINNGIASINSTAVILTLSASDPTGVTAMAFSNDGVSYTVEEPYVTSKTWALAPGDGTKTVYVRFRDGSLPNGNLYDPVTASIILDTVAPMTTAGPIPGTYSTSTPLAVTLTTNEPATIYYSTDGSLPTTASTRYTVPIAVAATTTIRYFGVDIAGNIEAVRSGIWTMHTPDMAASVIINSGSASTNSTAVTLTLNAVDPQGVSKMQFSNDGVSYTLEENYATSKAWTLAPGDGTKTVYVRFRDGSGGGGSLYEPVTSSIILDTVKPVTTVVPIPGTYSSIPVLVTLTANKPADIYYTIDGATPTTASTKYTAPISVATTTTIQYFSVDPAGNVEAVKLGTWTIHRDDMVASVMINSGASVTNNTAVTLTLSAVDPAGVAAMQFSNDGVNFTAEEPYATSKAWTLDAGNGLKTVYVRFRDGALPTGKLYDPVTASITMDTVPPVTTAGPIPGTYSSVPVSVTLTANESGTIYYTIDGSTPTTSSAVYAAPISLAVTATIQYFAVDAAGNAEAIKSGTWTVHSQDMVSSVLINNGITSTNSAAVTLTLSASDPTGVVTMQFSNDGVSYTVEEPYATSKTWALVPGDGAKTVYVRLRDGSLPTGNLYDPVTASIVLDTVAPVTTAGPISGTYVDSTPLAVTLTANEPATIYYTADGSLPTTASTKYTVPIAVAVTTTIRYFGVDSAGNAETLKSGTWTMHTADMTASVTINNGAASTNSTAVTLALSAIDSQGVAKMQFSNDGVNYTLEEPYATSKAWTLAPGDGTKTVYVRFRDGSGGGGNLYDPVTASVILDTVKPVTTAGPIPGTYSSIPVLVTLTANKPADIYYTTDGTVPTTSSTKYTAPISVATTTTIQYFSVDPAGNVETVKLGTWTIHRDDMVASVMINSGASVTNSTAVTLTLSAVDSAGVATMQFSNDGVNFTAEEPYATSKAWTLASGNGTKTVYARFRDKSLPTGNLCGPFTASLTMDTAPPVTTASPIPGIYATVPLLVTLSANKPAIIYYTTDGSTPTTSSAVYTGPISLSATTTIKYFAVDAAGNTETANSGTWTIQVDDMVASITINSRATVTVSRNVTLTLSASDPQGVSTMQFSSDGITYSAEEPYATSKSWTLTGGDGAKTVYVKFRDGSGTLYDPVTASIALATASLSDGKLTGNATVGIGDALRALQISAGLIAQSASDLIHGDVAPLVNGKPVPDGIIDGRDALVILRAAAGLVTL